MYYIIATLQLSGGHCNLTLFSLDLLIIKQLSWVLRTVKA